MFLARVRRGNQFDAGGLLWGSTQDNLSSEAGAETVIDRKMDARNGLEDGAFAGALVTADDQLGEGDVAVDAVVAQLIDEVEECSVV